MATTVDPVYTFIESERQFFESAQCSDGIPGLSYTDATNSVSANEPTPQATQLLDQYKEKGLPNVGDLGQTLFTNFGLYTGFFVQALNKIIPDSYKLMLTDASRGFQNYSMGTYNFISPNNYSPAELANLKSIICYRLQQQGVSFNLNSLVIHNTGLVDGHYHYSIKFLPTRCHVA